MKREEINKLMELPEDYLGVYSISDIHNLILNLSLNFGKETGGKDEKSNSNMEQ